MGSRNEYLTILVFVAILLSMRIGLQAQNSHFDSMRVEIAEAQNDSVRISKMIALGKKLCTNFSDSAVTITQEAIFLANQQPYPQDYMTSLLKALGRSYRCNSQIDSSRYYLLLARDLAVERGEKKLLSTILDMIGRTYDHTVGGDSALNYYLQALAVAKEIGDKKEEFTVMNNLGRFYMHNGKYDEAESYYLQGLEIQKGIGNKKHQAGILFNLGNNASGANNLEKTIDYYEQALEIMIEIGDRGGEAVVLSLIAYHYNEKGYFPLALENFQKSLSIAEESETVSTIIQSLKGIAKVYESMENYTTALSYYYRILKIEEKSDGRTSYSPEVLNDIGRNYKLRAHCDTAISYFHKALQIQNERNISNAFSLTNIGSCYEEMNQLDSAIFYLQLGLVESRDYKNVFVQILALINLGKVFKKQGDNRQAQVHFEEAIAIATETGYRKNQMEVARELYQIFKEQNNYQQALYYHEVHQSLEDSLFNVKNTEELVRLETTAEFEKEKQQLAFEQERENAQQQSFQLMIMIALGVAVLLILIIAWYYQLKKQANEKLNKLNGEILQQKDQLEELDILKSHFFTNISHEFRTPLTVINGMADQIHENPSKWVDKGIQMIKRNSQNLLNLVNQILDLRKLESGKLSLNLVQANIVQFLRYLTESFHSMAESKKISLSFNSAEEEIFMDYDGEKILRIFTNLLSNAIKFTPEGGNIEVSISRLSTDKERLLIHVKDTGVGIPESQLPYIFDRFYQVDSSSTREGEGTGIGLSLTKELVLLIGGTIEAKSPVNEGTTFLLSLPIRQQAPKEIQKIKPTSFEQLIPSSTVQTDIEQVSRPSTPSVENLPTLLIVEDNYDVVEYLKSCLEDQYALLIARDGQEGIEIALEQIPDLIISDVMMPHKNGFEVCDALKNDERTSHIPIVLLTAKADHESRIKGLKRGADAYLSKPFNKEELFVRLEMLLTLRRNLQARYANLSLEDSEPAQEFEVEDQFILKTRAIIEENLTDSAFNITELCQAIGMSRSSLHRKISALTGMSSSGFIRRIRLQKAKILLTESDLNISEIAYEVGFSDPKYFTRTFTKEFGVSPTKTQK